MYEIVASFDNGKNKEFTTTEAQWRYNSGQKLQFIGVNLPGTYEVHFSNSLTGTSVRQIGDSTGVLIPSSVFIPGSKIYAWIYVTQDNVSVTKYQVTIPIRSRAEIATVEPTPEELDIIEQAIQELNSAVDTVQDISDGIEQQINDALQQAKDSGEFDGADGRDGRDGRDGADGKDGKDGKDGIDGKDGQDGAPGVGVPAGGTFGQALYKDLGGDYRTIWRDPPTAVFVVNCSMSDGIFRSSVSAGVLLGEFNAKRLVILRVTDNDATVDLYPVYVNAEYREQHRYVTGLFAALIGAEASASAIFSEIEESSFLVGNFWYGNFQMIPSGGTTNQILAKLSDDDYDAFWVDPQSVGAYELPSGGIPKTDLAAAVQTSLGKADTALQSAPVQSVNGKTGAVVLSASDVGAGTYSKPSGGIPSTDLSQAVQTDLGKANSAYQKPSSGIPASDLASGVIPTVPTKVSDLTNDSGFVDASGAAAAAPVQSVNGQTRTVVIAVPDASSATPKDLGTAAAGTSTTYARADHVHKKPTASEIGALPSSTPIHNVPSGGSAGQVLSKASGTDYDTSWVTPDKGVYIIPATLNTSTMAFSTQVTPTQLKQAVSDGKLPILSLTFGASLLRLFLVNTLDYTEDELYTRGVFCFNDDSGNIYSAFFEDIGQNAYIVGDVSQQQTILSPSNPSVGDFLVYTANGWGAKTLVPEVTISTAGDVTQSLDAGKIYHFTGAISSLALTLNSAPTGQLSQYHFDFNSGSTAATITLTGVTWLGGSFTPEASKHYEVDILNGYGVFMAW